MCIWVEPCRRWRGGGPSRSPTIDGGDKPQLCRAARHRATPRGVLKSLRGLATIAAAGRGRRLPWAVFRAPFGSENPEDAIVFGARRGRHGACEIHADARRRDATLARNAVVVVRPSSFQRLVSFPVRPTDRRAASRGFFHPAEVSLSLCTRVSVWKKMLNCNAVWVSRGFPLVPRVRFNTPSLPVSFSSVWSFTTRLELFLQVFFIHFCSV